MSFIDVKFIPLLFFVWISFKVGLPGAVIIFISSSLFLIIGDPLSFFIVLFLVLLITIIANLQKFFDNFYKIITQIKIVLTLVCLIPLIFFKTLGIHENIDQTFVWQNVLIPIGISFYSFQILTSIWDDKSLIWNNKIKITEKFFKFYNFILFFPQLIAGPISRENQLVKQLSFRQKKKRSLNFAFILCLYGLFLKLVVANHLAEYVDKIFLQPSNYKAVTNFLASIMFSVQIYADFFGYCLIGMGIAKLMGVNLIFNFKTPYKAISITEFWRRWHISLGSFFRDLVFRPILNINDNKICGRNTKYILGVLLVFALSAMWHGVGITFLVWGMLHFVCIIIESFFNKTKFKKIYIKYNIINKFLAIFYTLTVVQIGWIFFRSNNVDHAIEILRNIVYFISNLQLNGLLADYTYKSFLFLLFLIMITMLLEFVIDKKKFLKLILKNNFYVVNVLIISIIFCGNFTQNAFVYFQF